MTPRARTGALVRVWCLAALCTGIGCSPSRESALVTRSRTDVMHKRMTEEEQTRGLSGRENGVLRPSGKQTIADKKVVEYDSICVHNWPNFSRYGAFEISGLIAGGRDAGLHRVGNGLLGAYNTFGLRATRDDALFNGYLARIGIWEHRFPALGKDWSIGTAFFEAILNGTKDGQQLTSLFPLYLRKRIYLSEGQPNVDVQPFIGISLLGPFRYANGGAALHVGSYGGANLFVQAGLAVGGRANPDASEIDAIRVIPYAGLGLSMFDFWNTERDMDTEWRYHSAPARRSGLLNVTLIRTTEGSADGIIFGEGSSNESEAFRQFNGFIAELGIISFPADFILENLTIGTSLANVLWLGNIEGGAGILPLRATYQAWLTRKLLFEPFAEVIYYPSQIFHAGLRFNAGDFGGMNLGLQAGFTLGNSGSLTSNIFRNWTQDATGAYFGLSFGLFDYYTSPVIDYFRSKKDCRTPFGEM